MARAFAAFFASWFVLAQAMPQDPFDATLPEHQSGTGLYATGSTTQLQSDVLSFTPQYPLWSDGADKGRWIRLPAGGVIRLSVTSQHPGRGLRARSCPDLVEDVGDVALDSVGA